MAKRYETIGVSSGLKVNHKLSHKLCDKVSIRVCSDTSSELEITHTESGRKERALNLDLTDYKIKLEYGIQLNFKGKDKEGKPKVSHRGYQNLGRWLVVGDKKKFVSLQDAFSKDIPFLDYLKKVEKELA